MNEKNMIILCVTVIFCVALICGTILITHNGNHENNTNNTTNNNTTVNSTLNNTNTTNTTTTIDNKKSSDSYSKKKSSYTSTQRNDYIGEGGRNDYDYMSEEYESNGHIYRDMHKYDGSVVPIQQD